MYFTRILLSIVFVLFASTALAAKPSKILVCHVGNGLGSSEETYQDNPDCTIPPEWVGDPADYICPDAGKIDLILVSTKAKHIGNPAHYFEDDTGYPWADYSPEDGVGDDPADFEEGDVVGIDRGCELEEETLLCPCWSTYTASQLVQALNADPATSPNCFIDQNDPPEGANAFDNYDVTPLINAINTDLLGGIRTCGLTTSAGQIDDQFLSEANGARCVAEAATVISQITWCPD